ncbi:unnamed protein product [Prunus armeniaca]|uniref:Uncharacterized protein n=1 Tax=Prunus armeniaca TaxID=36596 RepID=A0A6J5THF6_PRUAR|nr:unnamed protein product [Prunus armeniaca]
MDLAPRAQPQNFTQSTLAVRQGLCGSNGDCKMAPSKNQGASTKPASWPLYRSCAYKPSRNFSTPLPNGKGRDETGSLRNLLKSHRNHQVLPAEGRGTVKSHQGLTVTSRRNQWKTRPLLRTTSCRGCDHEASSPPLSNDKGQAFQNRKPSSTTFTAPWRRLTSC